MTFIEIILALLAAACFAFAGWLMLQPRSYDNCLLKPPGFNGKKRWRFPKRQDWRKRSLEDRLADMRRVDAEGECEICGRTWREHPYFYGFLADDGCGRKIPFMREACDGRLVKL